MKEAFVSKGPKVEIVDSPIPKAKPNQVVTKVVVSGSNPKDWKHAYFRPDVGPLNQGDDIAGIVHEVGEGVTEFKKGDRVAAFHEMVTPGGSYAEYAVSEAHATFHLPEKTSFEEGAAIPLAAMTAAIGVYVRLALPRPSNPVPEGQKLPLVIYGAGSAVGSYAIQFAQRSNIHPLICVAGNATAHVEKLITPSKGDTIVDYRKGNEAVAAGLKAALKGAKLEHAFDAVSEKGSYQNICEVLDPESGTIALVLPGREYPEIPKGVKQTLTMVGDTHGEQKEFSAEYFRYISQGLDEGWFKPQPQEVIPGGLGGIEEALTRLKDGKASAVKYVFRIGDTEGAGKD